MKPTNMLCADCGGRHLISSNSAGLLVAMDECPATGDPVDKEAALSSTDCTCQNLPSGEFLLCSTCEDEVDELYETHLDRLASVGKES